MERVCLAILLLLAGAAPAEELRIGILLRPRTGPEFENRLTPLVYGGGLLPKTQVFETLVTIDARGRPAPGLAFINPMAVVGPGARRGEEATTMVGTGSFRVVEFEPMRRIRYARFDGYDLIFGRTWGLPYDPHATLYAPRRLAILRKGVDALRLGTHGYTLGLG